MTIDNNPNVEPDINVLLRAAESAVDFDLVVSEIQSLSGLPYDTPDTPPTIMGGYVIVWHHSALHFDIFFAADADRMSMVGDMIAAHHADHPEYDIASVLGQATAHMGRVAMMDKLVNEVNSSIRSVIFGQPERFIDMPAEDVALYAFNLLRHVMIQSDLPVTNVDDQQRIITIAPPTAPV